MRRALLPCLALGLLGWACGIEAQPEYLMRQDVVLLGERHDNPRHHVIQADWVAALQPTAIVWEMLSPDVARRITPRDASDLARLDTVTGWSQTGWPPLEEYFRIFRAADTAEHFGAALDRSQIVLAYRAGPAALFPDHAETLGLNAPLPAQEQAAREAYQFAAHCQALPMQLLPGMVAVQRARDAALALAVQRALDETGGPVAVITGNGHARQDWGVPVYLDRILAPELRVLVLGQSEGGAIDGMYDMIVDSPPVERDDPCAVFSDRS